ncbi:calcitonin receptor-like isoform X2 [Agrilus planipennis]|uniref:Calcitonin receptor-like isoform X2 n=1 Tax=Agrilus planipennis TaxID=224129 RepID=A0A1W4WEV7_AGRPL|nr:calcitonin receptor-like isoform X2 [Agrilus planipennis]
MKFISVHGVLFVVLVSILLTTPSFGCRVQDALLESEFGEEFPVENEHQSAINSDYNVNSYQSRYHKKTISSKYCRFRNLNPYPQELWIWLTSGMCYYYRDNSMFKQKLNLTTVAYPFNNRSYSLLAIVVNQTYGLLFDYTNEETNALVANSFLSERFYQKWYDCAKAADTCCSESMDAENIYPSEEYPCPVIWDAWSCYPRAKAGTTAMKECPLYSVSAASFPCTLYSQKQCFSNGTWNSNTDYGGCSSAPLFRRRNSFHVTVLYISIFLSFPAVIIFLSYEKLRILRVNLHRNLLIACILRNILTIMSKVLVILDALDSNGSRTMANNGVWCKILAFFENAAVNSIYACMVIDGFYLHKLIVRVFSDDPNPRVLYLVTIVSSFLPSIVWAIVRATLYDTSCWMSDTRGYSWIGDSFRMAVLVINFLLLLDICRVLLVKLRRNNTSAQTKSTLKAMIFLVPLFGVPFLLTVDTRIAGRSCTFGDIFHYFSYSFQALQGVCVACIFCYFNKEVQNHLKGTYRKLRINLEERYGWPKRRSTSYLRRATATTLVGRPSNYNPPRQPPPNSDIKYVPPKLGTNEGKVAPSETNNASRRVTIVLKQETEEKEATDC